MITYTHPKTQIQYSMEKVDTCWYMRRVNGLPITTEGFIASGKAFIETPENLLSIWFQDNIRAIEQDNFRN